MEIGKRIRGLRKAQGLSQRALADKAGLSNSYIAHLETGRTGASITSLAKIADALGEDRTLLIGEKSLEEVIGMARDELSEMFLLVSDYYERDMIKHYREIAPEFQKLVLTYIHMLFSASCGLSQDSRYKFLRVLLDNSDTLLNERDALESQQSVTGFQEYLAKMIRQYRVTGELRDDWPPDVEDRVMKWRKPTSHNSPSSRRRLHQRVTQRSRSQKKGPKPSK